jgi:hypothetical protein
MKDGFKTTMRTVSKYNFQHAQSYQSEGEAEEKERKATSEMISTHLAAPCVGSLK